MLWSFLVLSQWRLHYSRQSVVVHSWQVQSLAQYNSENVSCCASLSRLGRVWQVHIGWVSPILDCAVIRASKPREKCAVNCCISGGVYIYSSSQDVVGCIYSRFVNFITSDQENIHWNYLHYTVHWQECNGYIQRVEGVRCNLLLASKWFYISPRYTFMKELLQLCM